VAEVVHLPEHLFNKQDRRGGRKYNTSPECANRTFGLCEHTGHDAVLEREEDAEAAEPAMHDQRDAQLDFRILAQDMCDTVELLVGAIMSIIRLLLPRMTQHAAEQSQQEHSG